MNSWLLQTAVGFCAAILGSMGMGGGSVLLIYLTLFAQVPQRAAQGINLLFFIPIAAISLLLHSKNKLVRWRAALPSIASGVVGVFLGSWLAGVASENLLSKLFGGFLLLIGLRELFPKKEKPEG